MTFGTARRMSASIRSSSSCPRCTVQAPGTSTCSETNAARAGLARAQRVVLHAVAQVGLEARLNGGQLGGRQRRVHQAQHRRPHDPHAGPDDVGGHQERDDRVEPRQPVSATAPTPTTTPTEVQTSVSR